MKSFFIEQYENIADWLNATAGLTLKLWIWAAAMVGGTTVGFGLGWINHKVNLYVWSPPASYYTILVCVLFNWLTGIIIAHRQKRFDDKKLLNGLWEGLAYTGLLIVANQWGRNERALAWMPEAVMVPIALVLFLKFVRNLSAMGILDKRVAEFLSKKIESKSPEMKEGSPESTPETPAAGNTTGQTPPANTQ